MSVIDGMLTNDEQLGAGIQLSPNATRLLRRWGVLDEVLKHAHRPGVGTVRNYRGDVLSHSPPVSDENLVTNQAPYIVIHRADLLRALLSGAEKHKIDIRLGKEVDEIDFEKPSLRLSTGEIHEADMILGADGERSRCRASLLGHADPPYNPGDVVYRIAVPTGGIKEDHPAWNLKSQYNITFWTGPRGHVVMYPIQDDLLNVVLIYAEGCGGKAFPGPQRSDTEEFKARIQNWDPLLQEIISTPGSVCMKWTLFQINELAEWRHKSGRFLLIGDAAHAILPCL